jgi:hypothetical protein
MCGFADGRKVFVVCAEEMLAVWCSMAGLLGWHRLSRVLGVARTCRFAEW